MIAPMSDPYFPPAESQGGWRALRAPEEVREVGGMNPCRLNLAAEHNAFQASTTSSFVIIRGVSGGGGDLYEQCPKINGLKPRLLNEYTKQVQMRLDEVLK